MEEYDLSYRAIDAGFDIVYDDRILVIQYAGIRLYIDRMEGIHSSVERGQRETETQGDNDILHQELKVWREVMIKTPVLAHIMQTRKSIITN